MPQKKRHQPDNPSVDPEWWKHIFDDLYLITDARSICDEKLTRSEADLMERFLNVEKDAVKAVDGIEQHILEKRKKLGI